MPEELKKHPHRRYNPLTGEWVLVSPHRTSRPWQGKKEKADAASKPRYEEGCYLCPGNIRANGDVNPQYESQFVFDNDFSALKLDTPYEEYSDYHLLSAVTEKGICRVVCFSPRHDLTLAEMETEDIEKVIETWQKEYEYLGGMQDINYVQIFENKGELMGCSNPHPHGQIWAQESIPVEPAKEIKHMEEYYALKGKSLLKDYLELELKLEERIVDMNDHFVTLVPFWAVWPFEVMIISRRQVKAITELDEAEKHSYAKAIKIITVLYDNLFNTSFPYSAGIHQIPVNGKDYDGMHFHMHFYPPLLRSAEVKKFMVGYEMLANPQRDITPEASAEMLRGLPIIHYKNNNGS